MGESNAFGIVLRDLRIQAGFSQEGLAMASELDRSFISLLERGMRQPTLKTILQLIDALEIPFADFAAELDRMRHEN